MNSKTSNIPYATMLYITLSIILIWFVFALGIYFQLGNIETIGPYGDSFGILNTLFSGLAFSALVYTIILQQKQLQLQSEELKLTREELKRSAEAQVESEKALRKQAEAYILSAIINGENSIVSHINSQLDALERRSKDDPEAGFTHFGERNILINELGLHNNVIKIVLKELSDLRKQ